MKRIYFLFFILLSFASFSKPIFANDSFLISTLNNHIYPHMKQCLDFTASGIRPEFEPYETEGWEHVSGFGTHTYRKDISAKGRPLIASLNFRKRTKVCHIVLPFNGRGALNEAGSWINSSIQKIGFKKQPMKRDKVFEYARGSHKITMTGTNTGGILYFVFALK